MRFSQLFIPTLKDSPTDADVASHKYMIRAGMIRQIAAGIYSVLPLGLRTLRKIENIIREEMNRVGAQEVFLPSVQPAELWKESGRWEFYGKELLRFKDRHEREFCYGPTHEEVITDMVRKEIKSYRQLPVAFYQIQTKFRDEVRPRFGIMRGREFMMKDAYSFHADEASVDKTYDDMAAAYSRIFERCGLEYKKVEADTGSIGGARSHEFHVLADSGEDQIGFCDACEYASNIELAECRPDAPDNGAQTDTPIQEVETPGKKSVEEVSAFLSVKPRQIIKTILFESDQGIIAGLCRGDREINPIKLKNHIGCEWLHPAPEAILSKDESIHCGYVGPVGLKYPIYADLEVPGMANAVAGANKADAHLTGIQANRDLKATQMVDIRLAKEGDPCPKCDSGSLKVKRGIELGHIFVLGKKYSSAMKAQFLDPNGKEQAMVMGCYGIGVGRTAAAAIEQRHDEKGICWPRSIAPFEVILLPANHKDDATREAIEKLYKDLLAQGIDALLDDRPERLGVKFKDSELLGIPVQVVIGPKTLEAGVAEVKIRSTGAVSTPNLSSAPQQIQEILQTL
ncbi:MAG: proline--tRNA ligase [Candidatus Nitrohelix vancouverensis]|uniref:Proline--tRNA ligase n=1 Tax=Candidatus Nitrohelix vancouverensis TaxID=2705534 RepID=A0A7T0C4R6_9BACT|nr:MAG: proline--tRNA ligase [Candidatus Nitrohelix vancouverensis]